MDMITTGIRTPVSIKGLDPNLDTRTAFFERVTGGYYLDFEVNRLQTAQ